jgi:hypothetical protein
MSTIATGVIGSAIGPMTVSKALDSSDANDIANDRAGRL